MAEYASAREVTRWWWIRHAPAIGFEGRVYGQTDVACDTSDRAAMTALARALPAAAIWLVSPLRRARDTAAAIREAGAAGPEPIVEPDFIEQNFGAWQGQKRADIIRHRLWVAGAAETPPDGENFVHVIERVGGAVTRLTEQHRGRDLIAVAHGGVIRAALGLALDLSPEIALAFAIDNLSITVIERFSGGGRSHAWRIVTANRPPR
ncbi:MAG: histidine phosphatase family protein [Stellaceae bacterium]